MHFGWINTDAFRIIHLSGYFISLQIELYENKLNYAVKCLKTVLQLVTFYYLQYYLQV